MWGRREAGNKGVRGQHNTLCSLRLASTRYRPSHACTNTEYACVGGHRTMKVMQSNVLCCLLCTHVVVGFDNFVSRNIEHERLIRIPARLLPCRLSYFHNLGRGSGKRPWVQGRRWFQALCPYRVCQSCCDLPCSDRNRPVELVNLVSEKHEYCPSLHDRRP